MIDEHQLTLTGISPSETENTRGRDIQIVDDDAFSYEGFQVVRGEFFAHTYEPSFSFNNYKVSMNTACIKKLPNIEYVQILVNPEEKKLAVRPCTEDAKDSFRWCTSGKKRGPKAITCRIFFAKVFTLMGWNLNYRYKLLGKLIRSGGELLFVFDLKTPEIYVRTEKEGQKPKMSRTPTYPAEWQNQFGVPVEEHQRNLQVNIFDGYAVFNIQENKQKPKTDQPPIESEESNYGQNSFLPTNPLHRP